MAFSNLIRVLQTESGLIVVIEETRVRLGPQVLGNHLFETVAWIGCTFAVSVDAIGAGHGCDLREDGHAGLSSAYSLRLHCLLLLRKLKIVGIGG